MLDSELIVVGKKMVPGMFGTDSILEFDEQMMWGKGSGYELKCEAVHLDTGERESMGIYRMSDLDAEEWLKGVRGCDAKV